MVASSMRELFMAVPVQIPLIAQLWTLTRCTVPRLPSQRQASAVPFDEPGTFG